MEATATETETTINLPTTLDPDTIDLPSPAAIIAKGGAEHIKARVRKLAEVEAEGVDATTESGRAALKSVAYKVSQSKTAIDKWLSDHADEARKIVTEVNVARRTIKEGLEALRDELKAPVVKWETAEEERIKRHEDALTTLEALVQFDGLPSAAVLGARLAQFRLRIPRDFEEYHERAVDLIVRVEKTLTEGLDRQQRYETEQAELEQFRADKLRRETEAAAEKARIEQKAADDAAEEKRKADLLEAARLAKLEAEQAAEVAAAASHAAFEAKLRDTEQAAQRDRDTAAAKAEESERLRVAAEQRVEFERAQAEEAKIQAAAAAEAKQKAALEAQRRQAEQERQLQAEEDRRRAENTEHCRKINKAALTAILAELRAAHPVELDAISKIDKLKHLVDALARTIVTRIAEGKIPRVSVNY